MDVKDAGRLGGYKRAKVLTKEQLSAIGTKGSDARWGKRKKHYTTKKR